MGRLPGNAQVIGANDVGGGGGGIHSHFLALKILYDEIRPTILAPIFQAFIQITAFMSALVAADRLFHVYVCTYYKLRAKWTGIRPEDDTAGNPLPDPELYPEAYPKVTIQLPIFNERDCCQHIIDVCAEMIWPRSRFQIQILDDSTCVQTQNLVKEKIKEWSDYGIQMDYRWRTNRQGFKAGAMTEAMDSIRSFGEYVCIFDADFHPENTFLLNCIPVMKDHPEVAFVQARWTYANGDESMLTRIQEISLNFHIRCEQYARYALGNFWNYNGTAGAWRIAAIDEAGGWNNRTTVEDMDLSLRTYLNGWKFVFLDDVTTLNELPASYDAYRKQQHRWSCGPMQLWRKASNQMWAAKISLARKFYINIFFFGIRLFATHIVSFVFYCVLVPVSVLWPEVHIPLWALVYMPILVTLCTTIWTPKGWQSAVTYVMFENAMSIVKLAAMCSGIFELSNANEWVVTTKFGNWAKKLKKKTTDTITKKDTRLDDIPLTTSTAPPSMPTITTATSRPATKDTTAIDIKPKPVPPPAAPKRKCKMYFRELSIGIMLLSLSMYCWTVAHEMSFGIFLFIQGSTFVAFGLNCVDLATGSNTQLCCGDRCSAKK